LVSPPWTSIIGPVVIALPSGVCFSKRNGIGVLFFVANGFVITDIFPAFLVIFSKNYGLFTSFTFEGTPRNSIFAFSLISSAFAMDPTRKIMVNAANGPSINRKQGFIKIPFSGLKKNGYLEYEILW
jgi:hypothetical protein